MPNPFVASLVLGLLIAGCGSFGPAFDPSYPEASLGELETVLARMERPEAPPTLAAFSADGEVIAYDPSSDRVLFTKHFDAAQAPLVAGEVVVLSDGNRVFGLRREDGDELFAHPLEGRYLVGAAGDGESVVLTLSGDRRFADGVGLVVAYRGRRHAWSRGLEHPVGAPAHGGALVVVPWAHQNLSFLRTEDGVEVARTRALGAVVGHAELLPLGLVAGQRELFAIEPALADLPRLAGEARLGPPPGDLPGDPGLRRDAYARPEPPESARHRVRLDALPARGEAGLVPEGGVHYFAFYSVLLGMRGERVDWVVRLEGDVAGMSAVPGGVHVATTDGQLLFVASHDGSIRSRERLPAPIALASFANFGAPSFASEAPPSGGDDAARLIELASVRNAQLTPVAKLAVTSLAHLDDPAVTAELAALCDEGAVSPSVRSAACEALGARTVGAEGVAEALGRRASFIEGSTPPPVGALARAATTMGDSSLSPLLAEHLMDPATPAGALGDVATALGELGGEHAAEALRTFLTIYHAYHGDPALAEALVSAARALRSLLGAEADELLGALRDDPFTVPALANELR